MLASCRSGDDHRRRDGEAKGAGATAICDARPRSAEKKQKYETAKDADLYLRAKRLPLL